MLVYYYSRINGKVTTRATTWQKQLTDEQIAAEVELERNQGAI